MKNKKEFIFSKKNYRLMLIGLGVIVLGFILMIGGGSKDPDVFNPDIFNFRRIRLAPALVLIGFGIEISAILRSFKNTKALLIMSVIEAIILGIVQGLTEFLPVSSSGHLELAQALFGNQNKTDENLIFTIVVHGATALATLVVFRDDVWEIIRDLFRFSNNKSTQFSLQIILSMIPAALVGFFLKRQLEVIFGNILLVGLMLWVTAALLLYRR